MRILVVKTHAFGDALLTTPAVKGLLHRGHAVTALAGPSTIPVWGRFPGLEKVVTSPAPCSLIKLASWSAVHRLRGFDRAIHFGSSPTVKRWIRLLTGCNVISGSDPETGFGKVTPAAAEYCRIAGVSCSNLKPVFPLTVQEKLFSADLTGDSPYVVLAPGGGRNPREFVPRKRWPMGRWTPVSTMLINRGFRVFVIGGPDDLSDVSEVPGTCLAGKLTWGQTAAVIAGAALFCGNDSGPAHLAVASATPALVLFGPTDPHALYPEGSIVPVCSSSECAPCYSNSVFPGCSRTDGCMESITVEQVLQTLDGMADL